MGYEEEARAEKREALLEMLSGFAWKEVALPALKQRLQDGQQALALDAGDTLEQMRFRQGYLRALHDLVQNPASFLEGVRR